MHRNQIRILYVLKKLEWMHLFKKDKNKLLIFRNLDWFICYLYIINHHLGSANRMVFFRLKCEVQKGVNKHTYAENLEVDVPEVTFPKIMCISAKQFWKGVWERLTRFLCSRKKIEENCIPFTNTFPNTFAKIIKVVYIFSSNTIYNVKKV